MNNQYLNMHYKFYRSFFMMKKIISISLIILSIFAATTVMYFEKTEEALASSVIRLHVIANSDKPNDQKLKLMVRDRILKEMSNNKINYPNISDARANISKSLIAVRKIAIDELRKNQCDHDVKVSFGMSDFPTKDYGNFVLPTGQYEALKIVIGNGAGKNWWCVLFPPLCFVNESCICTEDIITEEIENNIGKSNMYLVDKNKSQKSRIRFKTYEMWQTGKKRLAMLFD